MADPCRSVPAVYVVAADLFTLAHLAAGDALQGGERPARVTDDPHVEHWLQQPPVAAGGARGGQRIRGEDRVRAVRTGPAQVVVHVVLDQRAAQRGQRVEGGRRLQHVHGRLQGPATARLDLVNQRLRVLGVEVAAVVDQTPVDEVLDAGVRVEIG